MERFLSTVLAARSWGSGAHFSSHRFSNSQRFFCSRQFGSNDLIDKLIKEPKARTKDILDSAHNSILNGFEFSWHTLVKALKHSSTPKAQLAMEWRLEKMLGNDAIEPDCYSEFISLCGDIQNVPLAMNAFRRMESVGIEPSADVFNSLIKACVSSNDEVMALSLFEIMESSEKYKPNSRTYNAFITMYSGSGNAKAMKMWVARKAAAGFAADLQSYEALISGSIRVNDFDSADKYYEEMISSGILPNLSIVETLLDGFCKRGSHSKVKEFLKSILDDGWLISTQMAERLVRFYSETGSIEDLEELLQALTAANQSSEALSQVHCGVIKTYAVADRLDDVEYSVGRMLKQGFSFKLADDVEKIICSYFRCAAYDRLELFMDHIKSSYKFTKSTYDLLVAGYRRGGLSVKLDSLLRQ